MYRVKAFGKSGGPIVVISEGHASFGDNRYSGVLELPTIGGEQRYYEFVVADGLRWERGPGEKDVLARLPWATYQYDEKEFPPVAPSEVLQVCGPPADCIDTLEYVSHVDDGGPVVHTVLARLSRVAPSGPGEGAVGESVVEIVLDGDFRVTSVRTPFVTYEFWQFDVPVTIEVPPIS